MYPRHTKVYFLKVKKNVYFVKFLGFLYLLFKYSHESDILKETMQVNLYQEYSQLMLCFGTCKNLPHCVPCATLKL